MELKRNSKVVFCAGHRTLLKGQSSRLSVSNVGGGHLEFNELSLFPNKLQDVTDKEQY